MKKISLKNIHLILFISVGLVVLGISSTYALFTTSATINSPISLSTNFIYNDKIVNTGNIILESKMDVINKNITVANNTNQTLNYCIWYIGDNIESGIASGSNYASSTIGPNQSINITLAFRNNSFYTQNITIGVSFSNNAIVLGKNMIKIPNAILN